MNTSSRKAGVALIIVLGFLVIISGLAIAFFSSVTTEVQGSRNFASGITTRHLAESAVGIVMGQIRDATTKVNAAWGSQPGLIRVFGDGSGGVSAKADAFYKLYSSNRMVIEGGDISSFLQDDFKSDLDLQWNAKPALWTDLNAPVLVEDPLNPGTTMPRFPIIDPRAYAHKVGQYDMVPSPTNPSTDPRIKNIEGFWYDDTGSPVSGVVGPDAGASKQRLPMPTRWIYVLQDGTLTVPDGGAGTSAQWSATTASKVPSKANPIVGRVAFWTDDESSKVNLNTAGGYADIDLPPNYDATTFAGSFWDTPRFYSEFDRGMPQKESAGQSGNPKAGEPLPGKGGLAICQLLQGEFQRYPGHPGTTSLGLIFRNYLSSEQLYTILPRFGTTNSQNKAPGSTQGGSQRVIPNNPVTGNGGNPFAWDFQIQPKMERLFSSVDELLFGAEGSGVPTSESYIRKTTDTTLKSKFTLSEPAITPELLDKMRFFITAQSRSPELNLFGRPRVTVWPVRHENATESSGLNAFDNLILFCSTIGQSASARPDTTVTPANSNLYRYIFTRRELPAQATIPSTVVDDIERPRNKELMLYIRSLTEKPIPGFSTSANDTLKAKWDKGGVPNRDAILVQIFDYIRCANAIDTTSKTIDGTSTAKPFAPKGVIIPSKPTYLTGQPKGLGRFPTINEASLVFYYSGPTMANGKVELDTAVNRAPKNRTMRAFLLLSTFNPMQGYAPMQDPGNNDPKLEFEISGLQDFQIDVGAGKIPLGFQNNVKNTVYRSSGDTWGGRNFGGFEGFMHTLQGSNSTAKPMKVMASPGVKLGAPFANEALGNSAVAALTPYANQEYYQFQTQQIPTQNLPGIPVPRTTNTFKFYGATLEVKIKYGGKLIQTANLKFPDGNTAWPMPEGDPGPYVGAVAADKALWETKLEVPGVNFAEWMNYDKFRPEMMKHYWEDSGSFYPQWNHGGTAAKPSPWIYQSTLNAAWSFASRLAWAQQGSYAYLQNSSNTNINHYFNRWRQIVQPGDTIRSVIYCQKLTSATQTNSGDLRIAALADNVPVSDYNPHPDYDTSLRRACLLRRADGAIYFPEAGVPTLATGANGGPQISTFGSHVKIGNTEKFPANRAVGNFPKSSLGGVNGVIRADGDVGDFDTGFGDLPDGAYGNKQDEGNVIYAYQDPTSLQWYYPIPYFAGTWQYEKPGNTFTSPSRQMPSAIMMGSLMSRAAEKKGWETLSFAPNTTAQDHPGNSNPKDHLLLDLFQMPVVEPYPISEPFSTAGKVNLNYQIAPFSYISRSTALRAALHPLRVAVLNVGSGANANFMTYKTGVSGAAAGTYDGEKGQNKPIATNPRKILDRDKTVKAFDEFFATAKADSSTGFFKSASQICERYLYPTGATPTNDAAMRNYWVSFGNLVGDNLREKPYADLYPRVTTKSNTYTVHVRVQTLRQLPRDTASGYATWNEGRDNVLGEYRGSTTIERYLDPADPRFNKTNANFVNPDDVNSGTNLETLYRMRTVGSKRFAP